MPLQVASEPLPTHIQNSDADYIIFYSSIDESGQMWCPDCRRVEQAVCDAFASEDAPSAMIAYTGQKAEWKGVPSNPYKQAPWKVNYIPTILRVRDGERLVDDENTTITEASLKAFIKP